MHGAHDFLADSLQPFLPFIRKDSIYTQMALFYFMLSSVPRRRKGGGKWIVNRPTPK